MTVLLLPEGARTELEQRVREGYPRETCGLLLGSAQQERVRVQRVLQARNLNETRARDRYELDPAAFIAADAEARAAELEIVGIWHSHPDHPARPSETDRAAAWAGWSYVIVSVTKDGVADLRSWRLDGDRFAAEDIETCPQ